MKKNGEVASRNFPSIIVSDFVLRISKLPRNNLCPKFEGAAAILFLPEQMLRVWQHFAHFQLAGFRQPAVEDFEEKVALEIDEDRLGIFVAAFGAAAAEGLFARPNVDVT